jgi:hypothetical protein
MDAKNAPISRGRKEVNTGDMPIAQKGAVDLDNIQRGESLIEVAPDITKDDEYQAALAFMEEPVTIRIENNSNADFPETHVPCAVNGKGAEVFQNGQWIQMTWLPIGYPLIVKRKYVEVLARSKSDSIRTHHDDATVERPRNTLHRHSRSNYPLSIIEDKNPKGHEWLSRVLMGH